MAVVLALGSNMGDRANYLKQAINSLEKLLPGPIYLSKVYESTAVDYLNQGPFLNQLLQASTPKLDPFQLLIEIHKIESELGRERIIDKGPRTIDIDILYYDQFSCETDQLILPHPRIMERNFVLTPLRELPYFAQLKRIFNYPKDIGPEVWIYRNERTSND